MCIRDRAWAAGELKMRPAQRSILRCHALAKELPSPADIAACHAVAQACSVVHTPGHALGYPIYDLTSLVRRLGVDVYKRQTRTTHQKDIMMIMGITAFLAPRSMEATECEYASRQ